MDRSVKRNETGAAIPKVGKNFKPLVEDAPQDNISTALNLFYIKDEWVWVRGGGPAPKFEDISLCDYVRMIAKDHKLDIELSDDDYKVGDVMAELLFDGTDTIEGIVATLYTAGWAFAEIREKLRGYESIGKTATELQEQQVTPFVNDPFSLVWKAFKRLYPDKNCEVYWDQHQGDQHDEEYGFVNFPDDGSIPQVFIFAEHQVNTQVETFAHELAHIAVGPEHEHDEAWDAAFDAIFKEYNRLGDEMFSGLGQEAEN